MGVHSESFAGSVVFRILSSDEVSPMGLKNTGRRVMSKTIIMAKNDHSTVT
jgi:hypothetical protein